MFKNTDAEPINSTRKEPSARAAHDNRLLAAARLKTNARVTLAELCACAENRLGQKYTAARAKNARS